MPSTRRRMKKILAFRNDWSGLGPRGSDLIGGVGYYRIQKPFQFLRDKYAVLEFGDITALQNRLKNNWQLDDIIPNLIHDADMVWMKPISHPAALAQFAGACEHYNKPLILDMDDDYLSVDDLNPNRRYFSETVTTQIVHKELFKSATAITVSTSALKKVYSEFNKNIHILPNYNDVNDWPFQKAKRSDGRLVIGWAGSQTHEADFQVIVPVIENLWKHYGDKIIFAICGGLPPKLVEQLPKGSTAVYSGTRTMRDYHQRLANWGFDIGLAPLKESAFNEGKGYGKWMEYAMYAIPTVASDFGPYRGIVEDGRTGLLAKTTEDWILKIGSLIEDEPLRQTIGESAYEEVKMKYQWRDHISEWGTIIEKYHAFQK